MLKQNIFPVKSTYLYTILLWAAGMFFYAGQAQDFVLKGKTVNASNGEALSFVNLGVNGTSYGTASGSDGSFTLSIPQDVIEESVLMVTAIGFEAKNIPLNTLSADTFLTLELDPTRYKLNEVDVSAESRLLYGIVKEASRKIAENNVTTPYIYAFNFKSSREINSVIRAVEAKGELYDSVGYKRAGFEQALKARTYTFNEADDVEELQFAFFKGITIMDELLNFDVVRSSGNVLDVDHVDKYSLTLVATTTFQNDSVYVISYKNLEPNVTSTGDYYATSYEGELYISKSTKAVLKNITRVQSSQVSPYGRSFVVTDKMKPSGKNIEYSFTTTYQPFNGKYILSTIYLNTTLQNVADATVLYSAELIVEDFKAAPVKPVESRDLLKSGR